MEKEIISIDHKIEELQKRCAKLEQQNEVFMYPVDKQLATLKTGLYVIYIVLGSLCAAALQLLPMIVGFLK